MNRYKINNYTLIFCVLSLAVVGIVFQFSASSYGAFRDTGDKFFYVKKQAISLVVAIIALFFAKVLKTSIIKKYKWPLLLFSMVVLALVFVPGLGIEKYGAKRWINLGITTFQPSEIAKFGLICFISSELSEKSVTSFKNMFKILVATLGICMLIMLEPNMSITMCVGLVTIIMLLVGGIKFKHFIIMAVPLIIAVLGLILLEPYRLNRLMAYINPWASPLGEGYQLIQSYYALGSGGLFGVGLFNSRQKYLFLPFAESDFIFAIICEEIGFFGGLLIISLFVMIIWEGIKIAIRADNRFDCYLACGISSIIAIQSLLNFAVVTGSIPPTGLPLPFVSAGGSSLVVFFASIGILDNIAGKSQCFDLSHKM